MFWSVNTGCEFDLRCGWESDGRELRGLRSNAAEVDGKRGVEVTSAGADNLWVGSEAVKRG
jgi:hypothetical protein